MIRIGDAALRLKEDAHVLRFWEAQFHLRPFRSKSGQRWYTPELITKLSSTQSLLRSEGYTIEGAKKKLARDEALRGAW